MRLRTLLASTGSVLLALTGCTSDLPAPHDFEVVEPPPPENELALDCAEIPLAANEASFDYTLVIEGTIEGVKYVYGAENLPEGLSIDANTGQLTGTVTAEPGEYTFAVTIEEQDVDREPYAARTECTLSVNPRIVAPLAADTVPYCLGMGDSLLDVVRPNTGDGSPITCAYRNTNGNGRMPQGIEVDAETCTLTGSIDETRLGTWVMMMEGTQSGATVYVPFCLTNDVAQGYDITMVDGADTGVELRPIVRTYDPTQPFTVGADETPEGDSNPRVSIVDPTACGTSCYFQYSFLRTIAPLDENNGFSLDPDGLLQNDMDETIGFYHELTVRGPAVPEEFRNRPWALSTAVSYCITDIPPAMGGCADPAADGNGSFELSLIMVPDPG